MALIKCPECGKEISDKAISCPHCGVPIAVKFEKKVPVRFYREQKYAGSAIIGTVSIDGQKVGNLNNGQSLSVELTVGEHRVEIEARTPEKNRDAATSFFFGLPTHEGGSQGTNVKTITVKESYRNIDILVDALGKGRGLDIISIMPLS